MSETKHTPGPWVFEPDTGCISTDDRFVGHPVGYVAGSRPERMENGRLIAAAPELLENCEAAFTELTGLEAYLTTCEETVILGNIDMLAGRINTVRSQLAAAIRKAKGE